MGGKPVCLDHEENATMVCQFVYYKFSDGTYALSYGVEKAANLVNAHYSSLSTPRTYGSFVGNSSVVTAVTTPGNDIEADGEPMKNAGITVISATVSNVVPGSTNSGSNAEGGGGGGTIPTGGSCSSTSECEISGDVCRYDPGSG